MRTTLKATIDGVDWKWAASLPTDAATLAAIYVDLRAAYARGAKITVDEAEDDIAWSVNEAVERYGKVRAFRKLIAGQVKALQAASLVLGGQYLLSQGADMVNEIVGRHGTSQASIYS